MHLAGSYRIPSGHGMQASHDIVGCRDRLLYCRYQSFRPPVWRPPMPSADLSIVVPAPHGAGSSGGQPRRSPRVLRIHFPAHACRIYVMAFRASIGLRTSWTAYPAMPPRIRFLFVRPAICLGLPSNSRSPAQPLPLASTYPGRMCWGLSPLSG